MKLTLEEMAIVKYARAIRNIQKNQVELYEKMIHEELGKSIPSLKNKEENGIIDWTCDIMNCESDNDVVDTIQRIKKIEREKIMNDWTCRHCGKNTYDVECDYLIGTDHLSCTLENENKNNMPLDNVDQLKNQLTRMQDYITQLESRLSQLETRYEEPTN
jgi:succinate dehydrogenase/fumarate reductase-like Fe-S protein